MRALWIWATALALYGVFRAWYVGLRGPLARDEIERHLAALQAPALGATRETLATFRAFLEADDGREFFMLNLIRLHPGDVPDPASGEARPARRVLEGYTGRFMPALMRRAGHPAFFGRAAGGYVEHWGVEPDPGWSVSGVIRYRSRRDAMELVTDPRFADYHRYKLAAIAQTLAFPLAPAFVVVGPRVAVGLVLALLAALLQLALRAGAGR